MEQSIHILNQTGILNSFSIAKKITEEELNQYYIRNRKKGRSNEDVENMIRIEIENEIQDAIKNNKIPGLINYQDMTKKMDSDDAIASHVPELNRLIMIISQKLIEKKYNKFALCYFINSLVNLLGLTEKDFNKFHRKNEEDEDENDEDGNSSDGED